jgi:hypothetical protein
VVSVYLELGRKYSVARTSIQKLPIQVIFKCHWNQGLSKHREFPEAMRLNMG